MTSESRRRSMTKKYHYDNNAYNIIIIIGNNILDDINII